MACGARAVGSGGVCVGSGVCRGAVGGYKMTKTSKLLLDAVDQGLIDSWKYDELDYLEKKLRTYDVKIRDYPYATFYQEWVHVAGLLRRELARRKAELVVVI